MHRAKSVLEHLGEHRDVTSTNSTRTSNANSSSYKHITVTPIAGALGAEIGGVDLSKSPLPTEVTEEIRRAWLAHNVVFFRGQELTPAQYLAFARTIGEPDEYPYAKNLAEEPLITRILKEEDAMLNFGGVWHQDTSYLPLPAKGTMLYGREIPPYGGDTMFANQYLAYDALSDTMKQLIEPLRTIHDSAKYGEKRARTAGKWAKRAAHSSADHPIVVVHPETKKRTLYVNVAHSTKIVGMSQAESNPILRFLYSHSHRPEFTCRFRWHKGSIALWDNRCAMHNAVNDYHGFRRDMWRITLRGEKPLGVNESIGDEWAKRRTAAKRADEVTPVLV